MLTLISGPMLHPSPSLKRRRASTCRPRRIRTPKRPTGRIELELKGNNQKYATPLRPSGRFKLEKPHYFTPSRGNIVGRDHFLSLRSGEPTGGYKI